MLNQYSRCEWTAAGDLDCHLSHSNPIFRTNFQQEKQVLREVPHEVAFPPMVIPPRGQNPYGMYDNLSREMEISVYAPNHPYRPDRITPQAVDHHRFGEFSADSMDREKHALVQQAQLPAPNAYQPMSMSQTMSQLPSHFFAQTEMIPPEIPPQRLPQFPPQMSNFPSLPSVPTSEPISLESALSITPTPQQLQQVRSHEMNWTQRSPNVGKTRKKSELYYFISPAQRYPQVLEQLGTPTLINPNPGGLAVWQKEDLNKTKYSIFEEIVMIDEACYNWFPHEHIGYLYTSFPLKIPMGLINRVLNMCGDLKYDVIKGWLIVRGMSLEYNVALTTLVLQYVKGDLSWYQITENDLLRVVTHHQRLINPKIHKHNLKFLYRTD